MYLLLTPQPRPRGSLFPAVPCPVLVPQFSLPWERSWVLALAEAGFSPVWSAAALSLHAPSAEVFLMEQECCGSGTLAGGRTLPCLLSWPDQPWLPGSPFPGLKGPALPYCKLALAGVGKRPRELSAGQGGLAAFPTLIHFTPKPGQESSAALWLLRAGAGGGCGAVWQHCWDAASEASVGVGWRAALLPACSDAAPSSGMPSQMRSVKSQPCLVQRAPCPF